MTALVVMECNYNHLHKGVKTHFCILLVLDKNRPELLSLFIQ
jgi:hypothetical protein